MLLIFNTLFPYFLINVTKFQCNFTIFFIHIMYFSCITYFRILIHYFCMFNTCYLLLYIISVFFIYILCSSDMLFHIFIPYSIQIPIDQSYVAYDLRARRKREPWSCLDKYVHGT
jgi:hypothetical protein